MADCIDEIIDRWEGEVCTDDASDSGGCTKYGISEAAHPDVDVRHLTREGARAIYEAQYLRKPKIDQLTPAYLRNQVLDFAVNAGPEAAIRTLQFVLRIDQDGHIGPHTLAALAARDPIEVNNFYVVCREQYYRNLVARRPKDQKYIKGWLRRAQSFLQPCPTSAPSKPKPSSAS